MLDAIKCWLGFHHWMTVASWRPTRSCACCYKTQAMFRGAGSDGWADIDE